MKDRDWIRYLAERAKTTKAGTFFLIDDRILPHGADCIVRPGLVGLVSKIAPPCSYHKPMASVVEVKADDALEWLSRGAA